MTGIPVSATVIARVICAAALEAASITLYVMVYKPTVPVSTGLTITTASVRSPSQASAAVAPASV